MTATDPIHLTESHARVRTALARRVRLGAAMLVTPWFAVSTHRRSDEQAREDAVGWLTKRRLGVPRSAGARAAGAAGLAVAMVASTLAFTPAASARPVDSGEIHNSFTTTVNDYCGKPD